LVGDIIPDSRATSPGISKAEPLSLLAGFNQRLSKADTNRLPPELNVTSKSFTGIRRSPKSLVRPLITAAHQYQSGKA
jgi:hypothetical protein